MVHTRVGYAGGEKENPTYHELGDHTEAIQIDYDPAQISYEELLEIFWDSHSPTSRPRSRQYMSVIFFHDEEQEQLARESKARREEKTGGRIYTEIVPLSPFYLAEDYHQKYYLQGDYELKKELRDYYPDLKAFVYSTAAARINGYVAGYGSPAALEEELATFGLSESGEKRLLRRVR